MTAKQGLDPGQDPAGCRDGQLLADDLEQQGAVQIHRRQLGHPRPGIEVRPVVDEPGQHGVGVVKVGARLPQPHDATGIPGHGAHSLHPAMPAPSFMPEPDNLPRLVLPAGLDIEVRARVTLGRSQVTARPAISAVGSAAQRGGILVCPRPKHDAASWHAVPSR